jgi:hypothetical protein
MSFGYTQDDNGNKSSKRLALLIGSIAIGLGAAALEFAKAYYVYQHGGDVGPEVFAGGLTVCSLLGVAHAGTVLAGKAAPSSGPDEGAQ